MEISSSRIHMVSGLVLERMWMTKAVAEDRNEFVCSRLSETSLSILGRQSRDNVLFEPQ